MAINLVGNVAVVGGGNLVKCAHFSFSLAPRGPPYMGRSENLVVSWANSQTIEIGQNAHNFTVSHPPNPPAYMGATLRLYGAEHQNIVQNTNFISLSPSSTQLIWQIT